MTGTYLFAEKIIQIASMYPFVHEQCRDYKYSGTPELTVTVTREDIGFERERSARGDEKEGNPKRQFSDEYLESLAVYRKIAEMMPEYDTFLFHGSCVAVDEKGYLFTAKSGTGKSTHTRLWRDLLGDKAVMINDDKPLIKMNPEGAVVYGTPWNGKHRLSTNTAVPLKAVCIIERAEQNHIRGITRSEAMPVLLQQVYRPIDAAAMVRTLELIDRLAGSVKLCRLGCNMDISAAELSYNMMKE